MNKFEALTNRSFSLSIYEKNIESDTSFDFVNKKEVMTKKDSKENNCIYCIQFWIIFIYIYNNIYIIFLFLFFFYLYTGNLSYLYFLFFILQKKVGLKIY